MTVNQILNINTESKYNNFNTSFTSKRGRQNDYNGKKEQPLNKTGVLISSVAGVGVMSAAIAKKQGFSLNPKVIFSQSPKDWAMLKIFSKKQPNAKLMEIEGPQILMLATGSAAGGLAGGAVFDDKKHFKSKLRETVNQLLGNVLVPVICVGGVSLLYKKYQKQILSKVPQIANATAKPAKIFNKFLKVIPSASMTAAALVAGIIGGNKLSNFINEKVYHKHVDRKIKKTDFAPHVDDLSMAVTLMAKKSPLSTAITRTVPAFLCVPGYQIGTHRD